MRIAIGLEPPIMSSALYESLAKDPRLEPVLLPAESDVIGEARRAEADALVVSRRVDIPGLLVMTLSGIPIRMELHRAGTRRSVPYTDLKRLADVLVEELSVEALATEGSEAAATREDRRSPPKEEAP